MPTPRRAKIVCTIGPASRSEPVLRRMIRAGMDVARLNFSHGEADEHTRVVRLLRKLAKAEGRTVGILQDLQGPKLRVGTLPEDGVHLVAGRTVTLGPGRFPEAIPLSYRRLAGDVDPGDRILLDDGLLELEVTAVEGPLVRARVITGGTLRSHKGINIPGRKLSIPALTAKDRQDLQLGLELGVDYVALSFVRDAADVEGLRRLLRRRGADVPIIAKLEKPQAVENLEEILNRADGIMVARGDLGVELPPERVPVLQKAMIGQARKAGKPVITATQMLESMVDHPRPTRAEASDVANAIFDGTDAVMLSAETATGRYPVEAVGMMVRIIRTAEGSREYRLARPPADPDMRTTVADAIGEAACSAARELEARAICVFTQSGSTAHLVAKYRPQIPIHAFTPVPAVAQRLQLVWGVRAHLIRAFRDTDSMLTQVVEQLQRQRFIRRRDAIVITAGTPVGRPGTTNFLKIHRVGS